MLTLFFGLLSILAKPMALSLPLILLVCDWFKKRKFTLKVVVEKIYFFLYIIPITWITYSSHVRIPGDNIREAFSLWIWSFSFYIQKFFLPLNLSAFYLWPEPIEFTHMPYFVSLIIFLFCIILLFNFRKYRWPVFAIVFYFFSIFFLIRFDNTGVESQMVADRFMYLPSVGFCLLFGYFIEAGKNRLREKERLVKWIGSVCLSFLFLALSTMTFNQCHVWQNSLTLWNDVIHKGPKENLTNYPKYATVYNLRGRTFDNQGQYELAIADYTKAIEIKPHHAYAYYNRGLIFKRQSKYDLAIVDNNKAIEINPGFVKAYNNRGNVFQEQGRYELAIADYNKALEINPDYAEAYNNRGNVFQRQGQYDLAITDYNKAIEINPDFALTYYNRSKAYQAKGNSLNSIGMR